MIKWVLTGVLDRFSRKWGYDTSYAKDILDADLRAFWIFARVQGLGSYRLGVPREAWHVAKIVTALNEDCGPCTQLTVDMALADGVKPEVLRAVLAGDVAAMPADVALAFRFAAAVRERRPEADELREAVVASWGQRGLVSLAFAITVAKIYPSVKYALGHGQACRRVTVAGEAQAVQRRAA